MPNLTIQKTCHLRNPSVLIPLWVLLNAYTAPPLKMRYIRKGGGITSLKKGPQKGSAPHLRAPQNEKEGTHSRLLGKVLGTADTPCLTAPTRCLLMLKDSPESGIKITRVLKRHFDFVAFAQFLALTAKSWQVNDHRKQGKELSMNQSKTTLLRSRI